MLFKSVCRALVSFTEPTVLKIFVSSAKHTTCPYSYLVSLLCEVELSRKGTEMLDDSQYLHLKTPKNVLSFGKVGLDTQKRNKRKRKM